MRTPLICLFLIINLCICCGQDEQPSNSKAQRRRMQNRRRKIKLSARNEHLIEPTPIPVPASNFPIYNNDDAVVHILKAVLGVNEQAPSYNILPVKKGHCTVNGMVMYDKAVWSPKPCITCMCSNGKEICDETICAPLTCPVTVTLEGECCPVCSEIVPNDPSEEVLKKSPRTQEEMDELLRSEEEETEEENERKRDKENKAKKKKEERRRQKEEQKRLKLEAEEAERQLVLVRRKAYEEEELRIEEEENRKREEERKRKEEEDRREEEVNRLAREKKEREKEEFEPEDEDEDEDEDDDEDDILRGDVFRAPQRRFPGSRRPTQTHHPALPPGCFISEITVSCSNAKLTRIPPISDPDIKSLDLLGNFITSVPNGAFNGMPNLERIDLSKNNITSAEIDTRAFKSLKNLKRMYLDGNLLVHIPSELPSTLEELKLNENNLAGIEENSFKGLKDLVTLELEGNQLSEANIDPLAFKPLQSLTYMRLAKNKFRTIPQGLPPSIEELYLENNEIEEISEIAFNHTTNLNTVVLRYNKLEETSIAPLSWMLHENLESLDLSYNNFYHVPSYLPKSLLHLVLIGNHIERIPGYVFAHLKPGLEYLYLSHNKLDNDGMDPVSFHGAYHSLREIFLDYNQLTSVPVGMEDMKDLHILRLNNNKIRSVSPHCICSAEDERDSSIEYLHLENNYINTREISPYAFSCIRSYSSVILKPQKIK
ncbi:extracellular matrix protein 2 isoform X2 [Spea bombifrons]|uniref:extracellular matrix protein 2 isoform X2 n=1 Tax=Spea bombifrons TaxID=233779 RepID=UPI00234A9245|nr:extracellular matrix protein 2 isoform X2 [Spea bombifrons]